MLYLQVLHALHGKKVNDIFLKSFMSFMVKLPNLGQRNGEIAIF